MLLRTLNEDISRFIDASENISHGMNFKMITARTSKTINRSATCLVGALQVLNLRAGLSSLSLIPSTVKFISEKEYD